MLERIRLVNFKAARDLDIRVRPLTLLTGLNGSGKSTVLQALAAVKQSYLAGPPSRIRLAGPLVALGQGVDVLSDSASDDVVTVETTENKGHRCWRFRVPREASDSAELDLLDAAETAMTFAVSADFQYLQADRIVPRTLYPQSEERIPTGGMLGSHGEFTASFLARHGELPVSEKRRCDADPRLIDDTTWGKVAPTFQLLDQVNGWLQHISPGARLRAESLSRTDEVLLQFQYVGQANGLESNHYRPTHVGFGLTYSLPILVACLAARPGALLLIENPEAHLHPRGQARLGELIARCVADGVQILVETHSDHVLNGVRLAVKRDALSSEDVQLCFFTRDIASGDCYVEHPVILSDGQISHWPEGFFDQWELSLEAILAG